MEGTILVVDDEPANIRIVQSVLGEDYSLVAATSGENAIDVARRAQPDMILMDVLMPGLSGVEACSRILEQVEGELEPSIIFISSLDDPQSESYALSMGGVDYITKPIHPEVLRNRVRVHMANRTYIQYLKAVIDQRTQSLEEARERARDLLSKTLLQPAIRRRDDS